jgi:hypothetical protein
MKEWIRTEISGADSIVSAGFFVLATTLFQLKLNEQVCPSAFCRMNEKFENGYKVVTLNKKGVKPSRLTP